MWRPLFPVSTTKFQALDQNVNDVQFGNVQKLFNYPHGINLSVDNIYVVVKYFCVLGTWMNKY